MRRLHLTNKRTPHPGTNHHKCELAPTSSLLPCPSITARTTGGVKEDTGTVRQSYTFSNVLVKDTELAGTGEDPLSTTSFAPAEQVEFDILDLLFSRHSRHDNIHNQY